MRFTKHLIHAIAPGAFAFVVALHGNLAMSAPDLVVSGNSILVRESIYSPDLWNLTSFRLTASDNDSETHTFDIHNRGDANLVLTLPITISGTNAGEFSVVMSPASTIPPGQRSTFAIQFNPAGGASGNRAALASIQSNDPGTPTFSFQLKGEASPTPLPDGPDLVVKIDESPKVKCSDSSCYISGTALVANLRPGPAIEDVFVSVGTSSGTDLHSLGTSNFQSFPDIDLPATLPGKPVKFTRVKYKVGVSPGPCRVVVITRNGSNAGPETNTENNVAWTDYLTLQE